MLRSFKLGKLFGIPLYIHSTFVLLPVWMLINDGSGLANALFLMVWLIALFSCVVLHELGHALMARFFGISTQNITLYPIGGVARLERMSEIPFQEVCIALAGPAVNLVIAALLAPAAFLALSVGLMQGDGFTPEIGLVGALGRFLTFLWLSNLGLLVFNLLPCFPMDGGRVLRALLALRFGQLRATEMAARVGFAMAFLIAALSVILPVTLGGSLNPMPIILAMFVLFAGQQELGGVRQREAQRRGALPTNRFPQPELVPIAVYPHDTGDPSPSSDSPFSGLAWDSRHQVWVKWHNGRPVAYWR
jgi:Zn-dependent protease